MSVNFRFVIPSNEDPSCVVRKKTWGNPFLPHPVYSLSIRCISDFLKSYRGKWRKWADVENKNVNKFWR